MGDRKNMEVGAMSNMKVCTMRTWTTLMTQQRERGRETTMSATESRVMRSAHRPGPSSQTRGG